MAVTLLSRPPRLRTADIRMTSFDFNAAMTSGETERVASASAACPAIKDSSGATSSLAGLPGSRDSAVWLVVGLPIFVLTFVVARRYYAIIVRYREVRVLAHRPDRL